MELRKCCNHPFLIRGAEERILADATEQAKAEKPVGQDVQLNHVKIFEDQLVKSSGKMVLINKVRVPGGRVRFWSLSATHFDTLHFLFSSSPSSMPVDTKS